MIVIVYKVYTYNFHSYKHYVLPSNVKFLYLNTVKIFSTCYIYAFHMSVCIACELFKLNSYFYIFIAMVTILVIFFSFWILLF